MKARQVQAARAFALLSKNSFKRKAPQPIRRQAGAHVSAAASPTLFIYWNRLWHAAGRARSQRAVEKGTSLGGGGGMKCKLISRGSSPHLVVLDGEIDGAREGCTAPSECVDVRVGEIGRGWTSI
jgi:hypothetical protein